MRSNSESTFIEFITTRAGAVTPAESENNMRFSKYNNPNKRRARKRLSKTDADIMATKNMLDDRRKGIEMPIDFYEWQSKKLQGRE